MYLLQFHRAATVVAALLSLALFAPVASAREVGQGVAGVWIDHTGQGAVEIGPCGERVCGRVVWLRNPEHRSKSGRLICGTQILGDLRARPDNTWEEGWIYNPEDEERFSAEIKLKNENTLLVTGYLGIKFLGETFTWKRATTNLQLCAAKQAI